jgi:hypothetical protein
MIREYRGSHPRATYREALSSVLDYRAWHVFELLLLQPGEPEVRLTRARHSVMSGGEKSASIHLPLFAAANALYSSAKDHCPRMIALDEAFVGIDERYKPDLFGLAVKFDLDLFMTGHDLWVTCATVPMIAHYDMYHDKTTQPLRNRPAERGALAAARESAIRAAETSSLHVSCGWYRDWLAEIARDGSLTKLINQGEQARLAQAVRVLEHLAWRAGSPVLLPELAAEITGDTKALNHGTVLSTLVLRGLAIKAGVGRPEQAQDRRDLWEASDVVVDDLASRVLVLNMPAVGTGLGKAPIRDLSAVGFHGNSSQ